MLFFHEVFKKRFPRTIEALFWYFLFYSILLGGPVQVSDWSALFGKSIGSCNFLTSVFKFRRVFG